MINDLVIIIIILVSSANYAQKKRVGQPPLDCSDEIEDLAHLTPEQINKPLTKNHPESKQALLMVDI